MANYAVTEVFKGLGTFNFGVPTAGVYSIQGNLRLPTIPQGSTANSQVVVTVAINGGAPIYTGLPGSEGFLIPSTAMTALSFFNVTLSSTTPVDLGLNAITLTAQLTESM